MRGTLICDNPLSLYRQQTSGDDLHFNVHACEAGVHYNQNEQQILNEVLQILG